MKAVTYILLIKPNPLRFQNNTSVANEQYHRNRLVVAFLYSCLASETLMVPPKGQGPQFELVFLVGMIQSFPHMIQLPYNINYP